MTTRTLLKSILEAAGHSVRSAVDGQDAWDKLQHEDVELVVTDVDMPRLNGFELTESIRSSERLRDLPVVLITSRDSDEDKSRGVEVGADAYVVKSDFQSNERLGNDRPAIVNEARKLRVVVADDSAVARDLLTEILNSDVHLEVVGAAIDGRQAVQMVCDLQPDVVTMDIQMPGMDGFEATSQIMNRQPTPIVVVSGSFSMSDVDKSMNAIEAGALTAIGKPPSPTSERFEQSAKALVETVRSMGERESGTTQIDGVGGPETRDARTASKHWASIEWWPLQRRPEDRKLCIGSSPQYRLIFRSPFWSCSILAADSQRVL